MSINWKVRVKNKMFWLALIPALFLLIQTIAAIFGVTFDFAAIQGKVIEAVNALFVVLVILGIVVDPTTDGVEDSSRALDYDKPAPNVKENELKLED